MERRCWLQVGLVVLAGSVLAACGGRASGSPTPVLPIVTIPPATQPESTRPPATGTPMVVTAAPPSATPLSGCVNRASFIRDVTIPDGSTLSPGAGFVKTWRLMNSGSCTWDERYAIVHVNGHRELVGAPGEVPLGGQVSPGQEVDLSVTFTAPALNGNYRSEWMLRGPDGEFFGVGQSGTIPFFVEFFVGPTPTPARTATPSSFRGWKGEYFNNRDFAGDPVLVRDDAAIDFNWGTGSPGPGVRADDFTVRWTRTQHFDMGTYHFRVRSDDGVRLWVDGELLIYDWSDHSVRERTADLSLTRGDHRLRVEYYDTGGDAVVRLAWEKVDSPTFPDWRGEYWSNRNLDGQPALTRNDEALDFDWGDESPAAGIPANDFSARWRRTVTFDPGTYLFQVRADDGIRVSLDGAWVIDEWHDSSGNTIYSFERTLSGPHDLAVEYYEHGGRAKVRLSWAAVVAPTSTSTSTATASPTVTPTTTGSPPPPTVTPTTTATITPTPTATEPLPPGSAGLAGEVWQDVCHPTGAIFVEPGPIPEGCSLAEGGSLQANGIRDAGEPGLAGVLLSLHAGVCGGGVGGELVAQTTTGAAGDFAFRVSQQGEYCLSVDAARGDDPSTEPVEGNPGILLAGRWTRPSPEGPPELASYSLAVVLGDERRGLDFGWDFLDVP